MTSAIGPSAFIERSPHSNMGTVTKIAINVEPKFTEGVPVFLGNIWTGQQFTIPVRLSSICLPYLCHGGTSVQSASTPTLSIEVQMRSFSFIFLIFFLTIRRQLQYTIIICIRGKGGRVKRGIAICELFRPFQSPLNIYPPTKFP